MEETIRESCKNKINDIVCNEDISLKIEQSIYDSVINQNTNEKKIPIDWNNFNFRRGYMNKCRSIYENLDKNSYIKNTQLLDKILNGEIDPSKIAFLTPQQLFPENWNKFLDKKEAENEYRYTKKMEAFTEEYKCGRCKTFKCSYYQAQTRSADEPTTTFLTCLNCGHRWHF